MTIPREIQLIKKGSDYSLISKPVKEITKYTADGAKLYHNFTSKLGSDKAASDYLHSLGIGATMHQLRHRFGTLVCREGGIRVAQEALGHASPTSTAIYTQIARREIRSTILAALGPGSAA